MTTIVVFASSFLVASALVLTKAVELRRGKKNFFLNILSRLDDKSHKLVSRFKLVSLQFIQTAKYLLLVHAKIILKDWLHKLEKKIIDEYRARQSTMMGRKEITNRGSVSFYLKKITENKGNEARGRIE